MPQKKLSNAELVVLSAFNRKRVWTSSGEVKVEKDTVDDDTPWS